VRKRAVKLYTIATHQQSPESAADETAGISIFVYEAESKWTEEMIRTVLLTLNAWNQLERVPNQYGSPAEGRSWKRTYEKCHQGRSSFSILDT